MNKKSLIIILFLLLFSAVHGNQIFKIPEAFKPTQLYVTNDRMYIVDGFTILIYSLKDFKLIKKFGEEGEGPREFKNAIYWIYFRGEQMIVNSMAKISYFSPEGEFIKEKREAPYSDNFRYRERIISRLEALIEDLGVSIDCSEGFKCEEFQDADTVDVIEWPLKADSASFSSDVFLFKNLMYRMKQPAHRRRKTIVFIIDEVVSGFRYAAGGAQEYYGVTPDLAVLGKICGGGAPVAGSAAWFSGDGRCSLPAGDVA